MFVQFEDTLGKAAFQINLGLPILGENGYMKQNLLKGISSG